MRDVNIYFFILIWILEISNNLIFIQKEEKEGYEFYSDYLIKLAKKSDALNNETMKSIYIKASKEIVKA